MKKCIIIGVIGVFVWGWWSDQLKRKQIEDENRQNAEAVGEFMGGFVRGVLDN
jgi:hypothetical protein